ncbi:hypothetical protein GS933_16045 [Rhodococcus hoagii]|nr:hypothetical protein [Prescottella equi]
MTTAPMWMPTFRCDSWFHLERDAGPPDRAGRDEVGAFAQQPAAIIADTCRLTVAMLIPLPAWPRRGRWSTGGGHPEHRGGGPRRCRGSAARCATGRGPGRGAAADGTGLVVGRSQIFR